MAVLPADYKPSVDDLGAIMRARTRDSAGEELGTFTVDTRPTAAEAGIVIDLALELVAARLGTVPERLAGTATGIVTLRAAMLAETSYAPEQSGDEQTAYGAYREQYRDALADYDAAIDRDVGETRSGIASVVMRAPAPPVAP